MGEQSQRLAEVGGGRLHGGLGRVVGAERLKWEGEEGCRPWVMVGGLRRVGLGVGGGSEAASLAGVGYACLKPVIY